jgi:uncharacterized protein
MIISELGRKECQQLLARSNFGRLGCARNNQPYVVPIYFAFQPDRLYAFATLGRKIEWMRGNPQVCVQVDEVHSHYEWSSVIVTGRYEELPDTPPYQEARREAQQQLEKRALWWQTGYVAHRHREGADSNTPVFYCIHVEDISGLRAVPDNAESLAGLAKRSRK